ncbi:phosphotransferase [Lipingzhangella sp. LS1_29]|uniref:Phosphotransferase n=1 Tax=Lipingzhangella rawalii TaxID=2055835 RepID=A0ABU2H1V8_9ACTN|nr:phosphotransferase [Lipingzhangella rawalii]MDS1269272.1 phosphotransferase [Lipingzhangella rawalii]
MAAPTSEPLTQEAALHTATQAGTALGLAVAGRRVLGPVGANASVPLPKEGLVLRITARHSADRVRRELDVAGWLDTAGVPAVRPARSAPLEIGGLLVSVWHQVAEPRMATSAELSAALRRLHATPPPQDIVLPQLEPLRGVDHYLHTATGISGDARSYLHTRLHELRRAYQDLQPGLAPGPVHGDAYRRNFARTPDGEIVAMDLERVSHWPAGMGPGRRRRLPRPGLVHRRGLHRLRPRLRPRRPGLAGLRHPGRHPRPTDDHLARRLHRPRTLPLQ